MADIELVIRIPEDEYRNILLTGKASFCVVNAIEAGTPLPKGHGRLIDVSEYFKKEFGDARRFLDKASTIIEADGGDAE